MADFEIKIAWICNDSPEILLHSPHPSPDPTHKPFLIYLSGYPDSPGFYISPHTKQHSTKTFMMSRTDSSLDRYVAGQTSFKETWLQPWLVWLSGMSTSLWTKRSPIQFPVRAHSWVVGQVPSWGTCERQLINVSLTHWCFSPSFSFSLPLSLKINK